MIFVSETTLDAFRTPGRCELCGMQLKRRYPHHVRARGMDGGKQLDIRINLLALGGDFDCACHRRCHDQGRPSYDRLLDLIGARERCKAEDIDIVTSLILRLDKHLPFEHLEAYAADLRPRSAGRLAKNTFLEMGLDWRRA